MNKEIEQVLLGSLMGDGHLGYYGRAYFPTYREMHSIKQKEYFYWKWGFLRVFGGTIKPRRLFHKKVQKYYDELELVTYSNLIFKHYHNLFYKDRKKIVSRELLNLLDRMAIAVWYCDDGHLDKSKGEIILCTYSSKKDNVLIQKWFEERWNIDSFVRKKRENQYVIVFNIKNALKFIDLIKTYIPPSMHYKIDFNYSHVRNNIRVNSNKNYQKHREKRLIAKRQYYNLHAKEDNERSRRYRFLNKDRMREYLKAYKIKNKDKVRKWSRKYSQLHKEQISARMRLYRQRNIEKFHLNAKKYYQQNKEKILQKQRARKRLKRDMFKNS